MIKKYKKIVFDVILNICATALPLMILQLAIYPLIEKRAGTDRYGVVLTLISLLTVISGSLGNSLNNIKLIKNKEYENHNLEGDFSILVISEIVISMVILGISLLRYHESLVDIILLILLVAIWTFREYIIVVFRIKLNFVGIVINNLIMVIGYFLGLLLFYFSDFWEFIYILGIAFSIGYIAISNRLKIVSWSKTPLFWGTTKELVILIAASVLLNLFNYADRMIIYPMLGGTAVAIYYASTLFGKVVSSAVSPLNSVVLSYISKKDEMKRKSILVILGFSIVVAVFGYIICVIISRPSLMLLYPDLVNESMQYVPVMTVVAMITMISSVLTPFVMKFCKMKWQLIINGIVLCVYLITSLSLFRFYGLMGFCVGVLISNIIKMIIVASLGIKSAKK